MNKQIDIDSVRELRLSGKKYEAKDLLREHYKQVKEDGIKAFNEEWKRQREIAKAKKVCPNCMIRLSRGKGVLCKRCSDYQKKMYKERKKRGLCVRCGKYPSIKGKVTCEVCNKLKQKTVI